MDTATGADLRYPLLARTRRIIEVGVWCALLTHRSPFPYAWYRRSRSPGNKEHKRELRRC